MIFVVDENNCVGVGKTFMEAMKHYDDIYGDFPMNELKVFEGTEMEVEFVLKPKVKKSK